MRKRRSSCAQRRLREGEGQIEGIPSGSGHNAVLSFKAAHVECSRLLCVIRGVLKSGVEVSIAV